MDEQIIAVFCLCDDLLKVRRHREDPQRRMTDAEVMTTALVAARFFGGNVEHARRMLDTPLYIPGMLSKSRLNRRIHALEAGSSHCSSISPKTASTTTIKANTSSTS